MKTLLLIIFCLFYFNELLYSQSEFIKKEEEIKGKNNTYIKRDNKYNDTYIYNKSYELMFRSMDAGPGWRVPLGKIENKRKMHEAVEKLILPYVETFIDNMEWVLLIGMLSELDGVIKEVTFYYPTEWNIPITVLEELEKELLSIPLTFSYDRTHPAFKKVTTVWNQYPYGKDKFRILRDQGARGIIDEEDLIRMPEVVDPKPDKPIIIIDDDNDSSPINEDNPLDRPVF